MDSFLKSAWLLRRLESFASWKVAPARFTPPGG